MVPGLPGGTVVRYTQPRGAGQFDTPVQRWRPSCPSAGVRKCLAGQEQTEQVGCRSSCCPYHTPPHHSVHAVALSNTTATKHPVQMWNALFLLTWIIQQREECGACCQLLAAPWGMWRQEQYPNPVFFLARIPKSCIFLEEMQQSHQPPKMHQLPVHPYGHVSPASPSDTNSCTVTLRLQGQAPSLPPVQRKGGEVVDFLMKSCSALSFQAAVAGWGLKCCPVNQSSAGPLKPARVIQNLQPMSLQKVSCSFCDGPQSRIGKEEGASQVGGWHIPCCAANLQD